MDVRSDLYSWDPKSYEYKIAESIKSSDAVTDLDQYVFVVRQRISEYASAFAQSSSNNYGLDKKTLEPTYYVDIKSEGLRDILRTVLRNVRVVNLNEDKPAV